MNNGLKLWNFIFNQLFGKYFCQSVQAFLQNIHK